MDSQRMGISAKVGWAFGALGLILLLLLGNLGLLAVLAPIAAMLAWAIGHNSRGAAHGIK